MKRIDVLDLPEETRDLIREAEVQGTHTRFERNGRPVAMLVSYDEYLAMSETLAIAINGVDFKTVAGEIQSMASDSARDVQCPAFR